MFASPFKVFAVPEPVIIRLSALLFIVVPVIPVKLEPSPYKVSAYKFLHLVPVNPKSYVLSVAGIKCPAVSIFALVAVVPLISVPNSNELLVSVLLSTPISLVAPPSANCNLPPPVPAAPYNLRMVSICAPVFVVRNFEFAL